MQQTNCIVLMLTIATLLARPALAVTVLDNTGQYVSEGTFDTGINVSTDADNNFSGGRGFQKAASAFTTGTTDLTLNSLTLLFNPATGINISSTALTVAIYTNSSTSGYFFNTSSDLLTGLYAHPGIQDGAALVAATSPKPNPATAGTAFTWNATGGLTLTANTTYWIVLSSTDSAGYYTPVADAHGSTSPASFTTAGGWSVPTGTNVQDFATYSIVGDNYAAAGNGVTQPANAWVSYANDPLFFSISATVTPEPSKSLLGLLGCVSVLARRRKKTA